MNWYLDAWSKYSVFEGRASRTDYWMFVLFTVIASLLCVVADNLLDTTFDDELYGWIYILYALASFMPTISVQARRLHDSNRSAWWLLISLVPYVGVLIFLVLMLLDGTPGENDYGPEYT